MTLLHEFCPKNGKNHRMMYNDDWDFCPRCGFNLSLLGDKKIPPSHPGPDDVVVDLNSSQGPPPPPPRAAIPVQSREADRVVAIAGQFIPSQSHKADAPPLNNAARAHQYIASSVAEASSSRQTNIARTSGKKDVKQQISLRVTTLELSYEKQDDGIIRYLDHDSRGNGNLVLYNEHIYSEKQLKERIVEGLLASSWFYGQACIEKKKSTCFISEFSRAGQPPFIFDFAFNYDDNGTSLRQLFEDNKISKVSKASNTYDIIFCFKDITDATIVPETLYDSPVKNSPLPSRSKPASNKKGKGKASSKALIPTGSTTPGSMSGNTSDSTITSRKRAGSDFKSEPYFSLASGYRLRSKSGKQAIVDDDEDEAEELDM